MPLNSFLKHRGRFNTVSLDDLIMPVFVREAISGKQPVASMPGIFQYTLDEAVDHAKEIEALGLKAIILFGIPGAKDAQGSAAFASNGIVQRTIRAIKNTTKDLIVIADCCLCQYTLDGNCGLVDNGTIDNDDTRNVLKKIAVSQARAGADIIAPSGMITRMVRSIRKGLDDSGFNATKIMAYSAKYASHFYGPFREAGGSSFQGNVRETQLDYTDSESCIDKVTADIHEGADITMVKPALSYLDIISKIRRATDVPLAVYNVSGEYAMVKFAAQQNAVNEHRVVHEMLSAMKRAGADFIITYFAKEFALQAVNE